MAADRPILQYRPPDPDERIRPLEALGAAAAIALVVPCAGVALLMLWAVVCFAVEREFTRTMVALLCLGLAGVATAACIKTARDYLQRRCRRRPREGRLRSLFDDIPGRR